ncbi:MAG: hypothetical protein NC489_08425 [Ruminococcus flavefaciens]|nr:hypothetical protein [Ruminococcus flavefaciens]
MQADKRKESEELYKAFIGEVVNGRKIIKYEYANHTHTYVMQCIYCDATSHVNCITVLNTPDEVTGCRCIFSKLQMHKPVVGDQRNGWEITRLNKKGSYHVDAKCIACGHKRVGMKFRTWTELQPHSDCSKFLKAPEESKPKFTKVDTSEGISNPESHYELTPVTLNRNTVRNPKFALPGIIKKGDKEYIDTASCPQLFSVYKSMVQRAKELRVPIALKWYDDGFSVSQNVDGFTAFYMWSMRNGYCESPTHSGRNLARFVRKDLAFGFDEDNCEWTFIGT